MIDRLESKPSRTTMHLKPEGAAYLDSLGLDQVPVWISDEHEHLYISGTFVKRDGAWYFEDTNGIVLKEGK